MTGTENIRKHQNGKLRCPFVCVALLDFSHDNGGRGSRFQKRKRDGVNTDTINLTVHSYAWCCWTLNTPFQEKLYNVIVRLLRRRTESEAACYKPSKLRSGTILGLNRALTHATDTSSKPRARVIGALVGAPLPLV